MPSPFADFAMPADLTAKFHPTRPGTTRRLLDAEGKPCTIELLGWHSQAAQDYRFAREERWRTLGRDVTPQEQYEDFGDLLATLTVSWALVAPTGARLDVACTFDTARALYNAVEFRWLRQQVIDFLNLEANFIPASWGA